MQTSEQIYELAGALAKAQGQIESALKQSDNPFFRSRYADFSAVRDACRTPLAANGLAIVQFPRTEYLGTPEPYEWTSKTGEKRYGVRIICTVSVLTRILHASGQWIEDTLSVMLPTAEPQAVGSAITYCRRYALQAAVGIAAEDDDGEAAQGRGNIKPAAQATVPAPAGYDTWVADMQAAAMLGTAALQAAWKTAPKEHRAYLTAAQPDIWQAIKGVALKASGEAA